jgi:heme A synthase
MKSTYRVLAYLVAAEVIVQAAALAFFVAGLGHWVENGGVLDKSVMESDGTPFPEIAGIIVHGINGSLVIPALALILFIVSFFARFSGAVKWAAVVLGLVVVQVALGTFGEGVPALGGLHGINALLLFAAALYAGRRVSALPVDASVTGATAHQHATS